MMTSPHDTALAFRDQIAATAATVQARKPLRILVKAAVPLMSQTQPLGHLEMLLRLSFHGDGQGTGVLVFEWPSTAAEHSAARMLGSWSARCGEDGTCKHGVLELESRPATAQGTHFKVKFSAAEVPDEMLELLELAARTGLVDAARAEIEQAREPAAEEPVEAPAVQEPAVEAAPIHGHDQTRIDAIANKAVFDPKVHPRINPNEEVSNSDGVTFRLVMKRQGGRPKRVWLRMSKDAGVGVPANGRTRSS